MAIRAKDLARQESVLMNLAKVSGYLIERKEVTTIPQEQKEQIRRVVLEQITRE